MTEQIIDASDRETSGFDALITAHNAAVDAEKQTKASLFVAFAIWAGAKGLPPETKLIGVMDGKVKIAVPSEPAT